MKFNHPDNEQLQKLWVLSGSPDPHVAFAAQREFAVAITTPLRKGVLVGDVVTNIFSVMDWAPGTSPEFPLDLLTPGSEDEYVAYTIPNEGDLPQKRVEGNYVTLPTFSVGHAIDWLLKYARNANWFVAGRAMEVFRAGFIKKINDDGWHALIGAGADRNVVVYDGDATAGQFTKRLVSLMKLVMRRNAGGNSASVSRGKLTDLYVSPESIEDIRNWNVDQIDEVTRRDIFLADDGSDKLHRIFGVNLHDLDEFGENQEYQDFYLNNLSGALAAGDQELVVGLDLSSDDSFVMPVVERLSIYEDVTLHKRQRAGFYGWQEHGIGVLDNRRVILGSY